MQYQYLDQALALIGEGAYDEAKSMFDYYDNLWDLQLESEMNCLQVLGGGNRFFMRMYEITGAGEWIFEDYGYMNVFIMDEVPVAFFYALKSKQLKFSSNNLVENMVRHNDSKKHLVITNSTGEACLFSSAYPELINKIVSIVFPPYNWT